MQADGAVGLEAFHGAVIDALVKHKDKKSPAIQSRPDEIGKSQQKDDDEPSSVSGSASEEASERQGKLILDATIPPRAIRYPADLSLLREFGEQIIDILHPRTVLKKKPRTYCEKTYKAYLAIVKQGRPAGKVWRWGIKQQLQYLRQNLDHIERWGGILAKSGTPAPLVATSILGDPDG
ncbi:hypothetical protein [Candidatus Vondammii sp. HM_W22]|uniref:hypothetical protein n=1 Tax=Candidatus Vondammii sp. HM_W22 TaxID=2687299 RepID=UPI001F143C5B|nr:hypothetical protein [Candidatus Vondammii sp. HM_W22]